MANLCQWFGLPPFSEKNLISWQKEHKVVLKFYRIDLDIKDKRYQLTRNGVPYDLEPNWEPKMTLTLGISDLKFENCYLVCENQSEEKCGKPKCSFSAKRGHNIDRHRENCFDTTKVETIQRKYGEIHSFYENLNLPKTIFTRPTFKFCVFDCETLEQDCDQYEARLKLLSIGCSTNLPGFSPQYFQRKSSKPSDAQEIVDNFLAHVFDMAASYKSSLPTELFTEIDRITELMKNATFKTRGQLLKTQTALVDLTVFNCFGFNSSRFDLSVMFGFMANYANRKRLKINVLKKGSKYFNIIIGNVIFKDILSFSAPCSLEKYLKQWYTGETKKSVFPYQYFKNIEQIQNQIDFPDYSAFYSDLKNSNIPIEDYESAKTEYDQRRKLPVSDPNHIANFSDWLRHYQMIDVIPLTEAIHNSFTTFHKYFGLNPMVQRSLPALAFKAAFSLFDQSLPYVYTFHPSFDHVRNLFRNNQLGGLVNIYHRRIILDGSEGPEAAKTAPNGDPFTFFR